MQVFSHFWKQTHTNRWLTIVCYYELAGYPKTGKGMATGHVPVNKEPGHVKEDFRGPLTHPNDLRAGEIPLSRRLVIARPSH